MLKKQVANILKKANSGKVLTAREEGIVSGYQENQTGKPKRTMVPNQFALAKACGVDRTQIADWRKFPDFPKPSANGSWCVEEVMTWIQEKGFKGGELPAIQRIRMREITAKAEKIEFELDVEKGKYILIDQAKSEIIHMITSAKTILRTKFESEFPPILEGLTAAQIQQKCKQAIDEVCNILSDKKTYDPH